MKKLNGTSMDLIQENVKKLKEIFPEIFIEGRIDFDLLRQICHGGGVQDLEDSKERYSLTWNGKSEARQMAQEVSTGTLRPAKEESKNWDNTENIYIEGDNLEVLKLLQKSYHGKIKMIYIDPPYNTGNDILYKNNFTSPLDYYKRFIGEVSDDNFVLTTNSDTSGRYHSDWLSMMFSVLRLGRNLLSNDGIIVIAIDDYEQSRLRMMCDELFGEYNFIGTIITKCNPQGRGKKNIDPVHEYHLVYSKNIQNMKELKIKKKNYSENSYSTLLRSGTNSRREERPKRFYPILVKDNKVEMITLEEYQKIYTREKGFDEEYINNLTKSYQEKGFLVVFPIARNGEKKVWQRTFSRVLNEYQTYIYEANQIKIPSEETRTPTSLWSEDINSNVMYGTNLLSDLFEQEKTFDYPKSLYTVKDFISMVDDGYILDFFSGSGTTAHAVMQLNAEEEHDKKFILVQLPEKIAEDRNAYLLGYKNICEIGKERIRRAGDKIKGENPLLTSDLDIGFRVLKVDSSNMKDVYYSPNEISQDFLSALESNIKEDRTDLDLLFGCLLEWGLPLSLPYKSIEIDGCVVHNYNDGDLIACFEENISENVMKEIAKLTPLRAVFRDSSFENSAQKINTSEIFKLLSPDTKIKVI